MKIKKNSNVKTGHRESTEQHEKSDVANASIFQGHRKGDSHSGGGGHVGAGGGKKGRPPSGWEKGDIARDENLQSSPFPLRIKSRKRVRSK